MFSLFKTKLGRLRVVGFLEGVSLLVLIGVAVPLKHFYGDPALVKIIGPLHGLLFLLFVVNTVGAGISYRWRFATTTWKVLLACLVPFGTFYIDRQILSKIPPTA